MLSDSSEEVTKEWDYKCPQFCDFSAPETWDQRQEMDSFFTIDHEKDRRQSSYEESPLKTEMMANTVHKAVNVSQNESQNSIVEDEKSFKKSSNYETPPQTINKENIEGNEDDNDVFYSTKKSFTVEKIYKFRSTPMRALQHNGIRPLRESRITSSKKKRNRKSKQVLVNEEMAFDMTEMLESLPTQSETTAHITDNNENETTTQTQQNIKIDEIETENAVIENDLNEGNDGIDLTVEAMNKVSTTGRVSYVVESRVHKTVRLLSPVKSAKTVGSTKRFVNSIRKKGTPIRPPNMERRVRSQSIGSSLYSGVKNNSGIKYKSMAELVNEFETKPRNYDRSRTLDRNNSGQRSRSSSVSSLTRPISPKLHAFHRHRCNPSQSERGEMIAQDIKKYSFTANPIRKKLFDAKFASGIPRVKSTKAPTKAIGIAFLTEKRNEIRSAKLSATDDQPLDKEVTRFKANPMPSFKTPLHLFHPKSDKKLTAFKPFSFEDRDKNKILLKKQNNSQNLKKSEQKLNFNGRKSFKF